MIKFKSIALLWKNIWNIRPSDSFMFIGYCIPQTFECEKVKYNKLLTKICFELFTMSTIVFVIDGYVHNRDLSKPFVTGKPLHGNLSKSSPTNNIHKSYP